MKKNNKGFMMIEVIIVCTMVMTALIGLYAGYSKIYSIYGDRKKYYNIDGVYACKYIGDYLINSSGDNNINNIISNNGDSYYINITSVLDLKFKELYNIEKAYLFKYAYDADNLDNEFRNTFKEYLKYVKKGLNSNSSYDDSYIIFVEYKDNDNLNYSYLVLR